MFVKVAKKEEKTKSGIILPAAAQKTNTSGDVVAVGDGRTSEGQRTMQLKQGDTVSSKLPLYPPLAPD